MADGGDAHDVIRATVTQELGYLLQYHRFWIKKKYLSVSSQE